MKILYNSSVWDSEWKNFKKSNFFGQKLHKEQKNAIKKILTLINLQKSAKILDIGCGSGRTLEWFREFGFKKSIGIDNSINSIKLCKKLCFRINKDVFIMDARKTDFKKNSFDLVFADGLLEHFKDFSPFVREMSRISKKYILITQPNHFSVYGKMLTILNRHCNVQEYSYKVDDFKIVFEKFKFKLVKKIDYNFNEQFALLFQKYRY